MARAEPLETGIAVIGAGLVGLACAAALARDGHDVIVLERNAGVDVCAAGYTRRPCNGDDFAVAARRDLPEIRAVHLSPDGARMRPKLQGHGPGFRDFEIAEESAPGRRAASAIAEPLVKLV